MAAATPEYTASKGFSTCYESTDEPSNTYHSPYVTSVKQAAFSNEECESVFDSINQIKAIFLETFPEQLEYSRLFTYFRRNILNDMCSEQFAPHNEVEMINKLPNTLRSLCQKLDRCRVHKANSPHLKAVLVSIIPSTFNPQSETRIEFLTSTWQRFSNATEKLKTPGKRPPKNQSMSFFQLMRSLRPELSESIRVTAINPEMRQLKLEGESKDELLIFHQTPKSAEIEKTVHELYAFICSMEQWAFPENLELSLSIRKFIEYSYTADKCYMSEQATHLLYEQYPKSLRL